MELENKELQNLELQNIEQENNSERYIRKDIEGGYIYNKSEISYFRQVQKLDVANNLMLGDYNQNGVYTLNVELINQLVNLTKVYQYSFGSNMFCQSLSEMESFGKIDFAIKIIKDYPAKGSTTAILELLEPIDKANGYYTNTNTVQIDTYTAKETSSFVVDVLKRFNVISKKDVGLISKKREENIDLIVNRKKYEEMRKNLLSDKVEEIYKANFNKKLKLLGRSKVGKQILDEFNKQSYKINGWFVKEGMKGYYKTMDELLQSIIEKNKVEVMQDIKLTASLNKLEGECSRMLNHAIIIVDKNMANTELYGANVVIMSNNKEQLEIQKSNQNSKEEAKSPSKQPEEKVAPKNTELKQEPAKKVEEVNKSKPEKKPKDKSDRLDNFIKVSKTVEDNLSTPKENLEEEMIK